MRVVTAEQVGVVQLRIILHDVGMDPSKLSDEQVMHIAKTTFGNKFTINALFEEYAHRN